MKVKELIAKLQECNPEAEVVCDKDGEWSCNDDGTVFEGGFSHRPISEVNYLESRVVINLD